MGLQSVKLTKRPGTNLDKTSGAGCVDVDELRPAVAPQRLGDAGVDGLVPVAKFVRVVPAGKESAHNLESTALNFLFSVAEEAASCRQT